VPTPRLARGLVLALGLVLRQRQRALACFELARPA
jgi:hypothetical protein